MAKTTKKSNTAQDQNNNNNDTQVPAIIDEATQALITASGAQDEEFEEVQSGEWLEMEVGESQTLFFTGFEMVNDPQKKGEKLEAAVFFDAEQRKVLSSGTVLISKLKNEKIQERFDDGMDAVIVRIAMLPMPEGKKYYDWKVLFK